MLIKTIIIYFLLINVVSFGSPREREMTLIKEIFYEQIKNEGLYWNQVGFKSKKYFFEKFKKVDNLPVFGFMVPLPGEMPILNVTDRPVGIVFRQVLGKKQLFYRRIKELEINVYVIKSGFFEIDLKSGISVSFGNEKTKIKLDERKIIKVYSRKVLIADTSLSQIISIDHSVLDEIRNLGVIIIILSVKSLYPIPNYFDKDSGRYVQKIKVEIPKVLHEYDESLE